MKYYDVHNTSKDRWKGSLVVHLAGDKARGYESVCIPADGKLESVSEDRLSEQMKRLTKRKRQRPALLEFREVDYAARQAEEEKALKLARSRGEKKLAKLNPKAEVKAAPPPKPKSKPMLLSDMKALEAGEDLPKSETP